MTLEGRGSLSQLPECMAALGIRRPLVVGSPRFTERLAVGGAAFHGYHANPAFDDCRVGAALYRQAGCDGLISIGGGSAMDTAKGIKALLIAPDEDAALASRLPPEAHLPHIAVPATAGTGAEVTPVAVLYLGRDKHSVTHPALIPEGVVLDAALLDTLPPLHRRACALDALSQGIESWWAVASTPDSRCRAEAAIRGVLEHLDAYLAGDAAAADAMLHAAWESGRAIALTRTTAAHAMSYQITQRLGAPHGYACMLTLPHLWRRLLAEQPRALDALAPVMGLARAEEGPDRLLALLRQLDMPPVPEPDGALLDALADSVDVERLGNHPQRLTRADLRAIYEEALR